MCDKNGNKLRSLIKTATQHSKNNKNAIRRTRPTAPKNLPQNTKQTPCGARRLWPRDGAEVVRDPIAAAHKNDAGHLSTGCADLISPPTNSSTLRITSFQRNVVFQPPKKWQGLAIDLDDFWMMLLDIVCRPLVNEQDNWINRKPSPVEGVLWLSWGRQLDPHHELCRHYPVGLLCQFVLLNSVYMNLIVL